MPRSKLVKIGARYGNLVVSKDLGTAWNGHVFRRRVELLCDCGKTPIRWFAAVKIGDIKSCGCLVAKSARKTHTIHGLSKHPLFSVRGNIIARCYDKSRKDYKRYGGNGIRVCNKWLTNFRAFYDWCMDNGWRKGLHIDRIKNKKNYCPSNCRILTPKESSRNKTNSHIVTYRGESKHIAEWAEMFDLPKYVVYARLFKLGWTIQKTLTTKKGKHTKN